MEEIIVSLITGGMALIGVIYSNRISANKLQNELAKNQAVTDEKISELAREVRKHNNFAERVPVAEEQIRNISHRLDNLEKEGRS